jgi:hypothetical protein
MSMFDEIAKEKQRVGEAPNPIDGRRGFSSAQAPQSTM